jgi:hypothetical protein
MKIGPALRVVATAATAVLAAGALVGVQPAAANSNYGCSWPRVCFYLHDTDWTNRQPTASYQDRGYWQTLGSRSAGSMYVYNSRNDDGARLRFDDGHEYCVRPNSWALMEPYYYGDYVEQIKIMDSPTC